MPARSPDVQLARVRDARVGVFVGAREIAHLHPDGRLDLPLPVEIGDNISGFGYCAPHPEPPTTVGTRAICARAPPPMASGSCASRACATR